MKKLILCCLLIVCLGACGFGETPAAPTIIPPTRAAARLTAPAGTPAPVIVELPTRAAPSAPATPGTPVTDSSLDIAQRFTGTEAYEHVRVLTADDMAGRKAGAPGADKAADYIAATFKAAGLQPAGENGTYFQTLSLPYIDFAEPPVLSLLNADGSTARAFKHRLEFSELISGRAGDGQGTGRVVFVGRGTAKDLALAGDLKDTIALMISAPSTPRDLVTQLALRGVLGIVQVTNNASSLLVRYSYVPDSMLFDGSRPVVRVTTAVANELLKGSGETIAELETRLERDGAAFVLTANRVQLSIKLLPVRNVETRNVLAILPGSDPTLSKEVLIVGGHYDHVGADPSGLIFQGANDNASGTGVVMGLAQFFAKNRIQLKRSIIFAAWTAEEAGLVGSRYYVQHPLYPLQQTIGYINLDVVGEGSGEGLTITNDSPSIGLVARNAAGDLNIPVNGANIGGGSDHESFLKGSVPATFFIWQQYGPIHVPGDTFDKIDPIKLQKTGQVAALTLLRRADADH